MKRDGSGGGFVRVGALVEKLLGFYDKPTCDLITRFAKERERNGLDAVPSEFLRRDRGRTRGQARFEFLTSSRAITFFRNLIDLSALLPPKVVASLVRNEVRERDLAKELARARKQIERRAKTDHGWLVAWESRTSFLTAGPVDLAAAPLLGSEASATQNGRRAPKPGDLYLLHRLDEIDRRGETLNDTARVQAEKALYLLGLDEFDIAEALLDEALAGAQNHAFCNYAAAMAALARARRRTVDANRYTLMMEEADRPSHEAEWEDCASEAIGDVLSPRKKALTRLLRAYEHWPQQKDGPHTWFIDHQQRNEAIALAADIAFQLSHDHGSVDFDTLRKIEARRRGEPVQWFFAADLDRILLAVLREYEAHGARPQDWRRSRFELTTVLLQLYFVLSPSEYTRYLPAWRKTLGDAIVSDVEPFLIEQGYPNPTARVVREHIQRAMSTDERTAMLQNLKERHQADMRRFYGEVAAFLARTRDDELDELDELDA
jgi:hypothetical protein